MSSARAASLVLSERLYYGQELTAADVQRVAPGLAAAKIQEVLQTAALIVQDVRERQEELSTKVAVRRTKQIMSPQVLLYPDEWKWKLD